MSDEQNPWHHDGKVPESLAPSTERPLAQILWRRLLSYEPRRYQLILGPRRVGKTTVLYQTVRHLLDNGIEPGRIWWLRLDHPLLIGLDLGRFTRKVLEISGGTVDRPAYLMLDELVYGQSWDLWLKTFHDERWPIRVAATSSATADLRNRRLESGVGRWTEQYLSPYGFGEFCEMTGRLPHPYSTAGETLGETLCSLPPGQATSPELDALRRIFLLVGGFPELLIGLVADITSASKDGEDNEPYELTLLLKAQQELRRDAVERTIYKDIPQSFGVDSPLLLERLLYVLAGQITGLLSPSNISREIGLSQATFERYLSYLERSYLIFTLPSYSGSEGTVQKRGRKLYFVDGAIRTAALQRGMASLHDPTEQGPLLENLAATSLRTLADQSGIRLYYWRDGKHEVDLVFDDPRGPLAFEIGASSDHSRSGLLALTERHERFRGRSYVVAPRAAIAAPESTATGVGALSLDAFLLAVSAQSHQALARSVGVTI